MTGLTIFDISHAGLLGMVAWVFTNILLEDGMVFSKWWKILNILPQWMAKPLGACEYCLAGQLAFWYYFYENFFIYNFVDHVCYISFSIFTVKIINVIINGTKGN